MRKVLLGAAVLVTSLGLVGSVAAAQTGGGVIDNTGPGSDASIRTKVKVDTDINNRNDFDITNHNSQAALSGEAEVTRNNGGGSAVTGDARNTNSFQLSATVHNNTGDIIGASVPTNLFDVGGGRISDTGPGSDASITTKVRSETRVDNQNTFTITNENTQSAASGDVEVSNNNGGGSAVSGDATNTNSTNIQLNVSN
jgi:hypothetical protein